MGKINYIICGLCKATVAECDLHAHLLKLHGWFGHQQPNFTHNSHYKKSTKKSTKKSSSTPPAKQSFNKISTPSRESQALNVMSCSICGCSVSNKRHAKHEAACRENVNKLRIELEKAQLTKTATKPLKVVICPHCSMPLTEKKLKSHLEKRCPMRTSSSMDANSTFNNIKSGKANNGKTLSTTFNDPVIAEYLRKHPEPPRYGPQGVPQDKYRRSAYGRSGMEYDAWSREK